MLDQLGLGIVLTLQDDFSPNANRAVQSMNQLEGSAEAMSRNVSNSMNNLQNIMLAGFSLDTVGGKFQKAGNTILGVFKQLGAQVIETGSKFDTLKAQFKTVFGSDSEVKKNLDWATNFAIKTPFDIEGTARAMQMMKSQGMDVKMEFKNAKGEMKSLLEYMGDLSTKNMSSTGGFQGMAYSVSNLLGGDGGRSLRAKFDLSKKQVEELKGLVDSNDMTKFGEAFAKMADEVTPNAMKNMYGTWAQVISEMQETWEMFTWKVGEAGSFDAMKKTLGVITGGIKGLVTESNIQAFSDIISYLWQPIDLVVRGLSKIVEWTLKFTEQNPTLAKIGATLVVISGAGLVLTGTIMKLFGGVMILGASLASAYLNFVLIRGLNMAGDFNFMWRSVLRLATSLGGLALLAGGLALAYKSNFMGIRDAGISTWNDIRTAWEESTNVMSMGGTELSGYKRRISDLGYSFAKVRVFGMAFWNTLTGKVVNGELQYTQKQLDQLDAFGLMPVAQTMAIVRDRATHMWNGFREGLGSAFVMARNFLQFVLMPIQAVIDTLKERAKPLGEALSRIFGFKGDQGMKLSEAQKQQKMFEDIGKKAGIALGVIMGFKVIGTLSKIISSPFKLMYNSIHKSIGAIKALKAITSSGIGIPGQQRNGIINQVRGYGTTVADRVRRVRARGNQFLDEYQDLPDSRGRGYENGYRRLSAEAIPRRFRDHILTNNHPNVNMSQVDIQQRSPFMRRLLGDRYSTLNADGTRTNLGSYGGRFNQNRDDIQTRLGIQNAISRGGTIRHHDTLSNNTRNNGDVTLPRPANYVGRAGEYQREMSRITRVDTQHGNARHLRGYASTVGARAQGAVDSHIQSQWADRYRIMGEDGRRYNGVGADQERRRAEFNERFRNHMNTQDPTSRTIRNNATREARSDANSAVFRDTRQGRLSQALFGQRHYTVRTDAQGNQTQRVVARRGGIFRSASQDMVYNPEQSGRERLGAIGTRARAGVTRVGRGALGLARRGASEFVDQSGIGRAGAHFAGLGRSVGGSIGRGASRFGEASGATNAIRHFRNLGRGARGALGTAVRAPGNYINNQRERLGMSRITRPAFMNRPEGEGRLARVRRVGGGVINSFRGEQRDADGNVTRRAGGARRAIGAVGSGVGVARRGIGRGVRGVGRVAGGIGRGIGAVGRMAGTGLAVAGAGVAVGRMAYSAISSRGKGKDGKGNFNEGLKNINKDMKKMDMGKIWANFSKEARKAFGSIGDIAKTAFKKLAPVIKPALAEAWEGLKAGAKIAWEWVKENGASTLKSMGSAIAPMIGDIFNGIKVVAGEAWNWVQTNGAQAFGQFVAWCIGTGIPMLLQGLKGIAVFVGGTVIPSLIGIFASGLATIAGAIKSSIQGAFQSAWNFVKGLFSGLGNILVGSLPKSVQGVVTKALGMGGGGKKGVKSHQGKWLSSYEYDATLHKDESVLPPMISKRFNHLLGNLESNPELGKRSKPKETPVIQQVKGKGSGGDTISIAKVEVIVQAEKLSKTDARKQAMLILDEFKKLKKEQDIRNYV